LFVVSLIIAAVAIIAVVKLFPSKTLRQFDVAIVEPVIASASSGDEIADISRGLVSVIDERLEAFAHLRTLTMAVGLSMIFGIMLDGMIAWTVRARLHRRWPVNLLLAAFGLGAIISLAGVLVVWRIDPVAGFRDELQHASAAEPSVAASASALLDLADRCVSMEMGQRYFIVLGFGTLALVFGAASLAGALAWRHVARNVTEFEGVIMERV
jgi:hypothetical protein